MNYIKLQGTGLDISPICLGCMSFGDPDQGNHPWSLDETASRPFFERALELGINFFDTGEDYSDGTSEEYLGRAIRDLADREQVVIATKAGGPGRANPGPNGAGLSRKAIYTEVENSLRRLGTEYIDLYQIHRWDPDTPIVETMSALHDLVQRGVVRYLGASSMFAWQFAKAQHVAEMRGWTKFVSMQSYYHLLHREEEREMLPLCIDQNVSVLPWSPLARGRLTRDMDAVTNRTQQDAYGNHLFAEISASDQEIIDRVRHVANEHGVTRAQVALAWLRHNPIVGAPVLGVTKLEHLDDAVASLDVDLSPSELQFLEEPYATRPVAGFADMSSIGASSAAKRQVFV